MASKLSVLVLTLVLVALKRCATSNVVGNRDLSCFFCEYQMTNACGDNSDITALTSVSCNSLNFTPPFKGENRRAVTEDVLSRVVDGKFRSAPLIRDIFKTNTELVNEISFKYVCLKIYITSENKKGAIRTCIKQENTIKDACDFIQQEIDAEFKVNSCYSCEYDNCNSATYIKVSILLITWTLLFGILK